MILLTGTTPAAAVVYAYVYALLNRGPTNPYRVGLTASGSNDAWAPSSESKAPGRKAWGFFVGADLTQRLRNASNRAGKSSSGKR